MVTITVIQPSDQISASRDTINTNFANLNTEVSNNLVTVGASQTISGTKTFTDKIVIDSGSDQQITLKNSTFAQYIRNYLGTLIIYHSIPSGGVNTQVDSSGNWNMPAGLSVNSQNRTVASSYTPTVSGDSGSGATMSITEAKYSEKGDMARVSVRGVISSKGTCTGAIKITLPTGSAGGSIPLSGGIFAIGTGPNTSRGRPQIPINGAVQFTKSSQSALVQRSDISVNDEVLFNGRYKK